MTNRQSDREKVYASNLSMRWGWEGVGESYKKVLNFTNLYVKFWVWRYSLIFYRCILLLSNIHSHFLLYRRHFRCIFTTPCQIIQSKYRHHALMNMLSTLSTSSSVPLTPLPTPCLLHHYRHHRLILILPSSYFPFLPPPASSSSPPPPSSPPSFSHPPLPLFHPSIPPSFSSPSSSTFSSSCSSSSHPLCPPSSSSSPPPLFLPSSSSPPSSSTSSSSSHPLCLPSSSSSPAPLF